MNRNFIGDAIVSTKFVIVPLFVVIVYIFSAYITSIFLYGDRLSIDAIFEKNIRLGSNPLISVNTINIDVSQGGSKGVAKLSVSGLSSGVSKVDSVEIEGDSRDNATTDNGCDEYVFAFHIMWCLYLSFLVLFFGFPSRKDDELNG